MPTINRKVLQPKQPKYKKEKQLNYYGLKQWKELRNSYYELHPLCEICMQHDVLEPADEVHHRTPFLTGETNEERIDILLDWDNLMSVCKKCHTALHNKRDRYKMKRVDYLTDKEYNKAHNLLSLND